MILLRPGVAGHGSLHVPGFVFQQGETQTQRSAGAPLRNRKVPALDCQYVARGDSLLAVMRTKASWARMVVAIFTVAMFYASVCSTTCAIGVCPNQVQQTASHDCDQASPHHSRHSDQPGHQAPENPDCSQHGHPGSFLAKSSELSQIQLSVVGHLDASASAVSPGRSVVASLTIAEASDLAPPLRSNTPLYQQISVLRI